MYQTDRSRLLAASIQAFLEIEILPNEARWLRCPFEKTETELRLLKEKAVTTGGWNLYQKKENGGAGLSLVEVALLSEILGRSPFGHFVFNCQAPDAGNLELLAKYGTPEIHEKFMRPLLRGEIRSCFAMTEPETAGSNPVLLAATARRDGESYIIDGKKWFTTAADGAAFAIVMAVTDEKTENPYKKASMIVVPTDALGFSIKRNVEVLGHAGSGWDSHSEVIFERVRVPVSNRLGGSGDGFRLAQERLGPGRIHHCMRWLGICERAFDLMCRRAATRSLGEGRFLGEKQMIQAFIADSRAEIDAARLLILHCARKIDLEGSRAASEEISTIKFFAADVLWHVIDRAIQTHGALGLTEDTLLSLYFREARAARIYDGADEVHKSSLARQILKKYGLEIRNN